MSKFKILLLLQFILFSALPVLAQVDTAWVRRYNGPGNAEDVPTALAVDASGNVYVTGNTATIKYLPNGDSAWIRTGYSGADIAVDGSGNVYVTGPSGTIKYLPNGNTNWVRYYGTQGAALAVDGSGNLYVTGYSTDGGVATYDYVTIKYAPNGDTLWVRRYNGPANDYDVASALALDESGNVYVTGNSAATSYPDFDYATIKYTSNGDTLWVRRYNGPGNGGDEARALGLDGSGNLYVTGYSPGSGTLYDYATIKYAPNGDTLWVRRYNGPGNLSDQAYTLTLDGSGNLYVAGYSYGSGTYYDYATIKYAPNGDTLWVRRYNGPGYIEDGARASVLDGSGNVYVTGYSIGTIYADYDYATIKYIPNGDALWVRRYNGPGNWLDQASALALDGSGDLYVTGTSYGSGTGYDYATIKYSTSSCTAKPGDVNEDGSYNLPDIIGEVNIVFKGALAPTPNCRADANGDTNISLPDIIKLVNKVFKGGPTPPPIGVCCL